MSTADASPGQQETLSGRSRVVLEFERFRPGEIKEIPPVGGPVVDGNRMDHVPKDIEKYLQIRYGPDVQVGVGSRFGEENGSGYSYNVWTQQHERIATMKAERITVWMVPPDYPKDGPLQRALDKVQQRNILLTNGSRPEELIRTLWVMDENSTGHQRYLAQKNFRLTPRVPIKFGSAPAPKIK